MTTFPVRPMPPNQPDIFVWCGTATSWTPSPNLAGQQHIAADGVGAHEDLAALEAGVVNVVEREGGCSQTDGRG